MKTVVRIDELQLSQNGTLVCTSKLSGDFSSTIWRRESADLLPVIREDQHYEGMPEGKTFNHIQDEFALDEWGRYTFARI